MFKYYALTVVVYLLLMTAGGIVYGIYPLAGILMGIMNTICFVGEWYYTYQVEKTR